MLSDAQQCNSVFLYLSTVVLHSVSSVIHGLIILNHGAVFSHIGDSKAFPLNASLLYLLITLFFCTFLLGFYCDRR